MRLKYSTKEPSQNESDSLPRVPLIFPHDNKAIEVISLVDSGATVSVLPYEVGIQLGCVWDEREAVIRLAGNLGSRPAKPLVVMAEIGDFAPVRLAFAWSRAEGIPLILGQTNFFLEFDICFYRSKLEFEIEKS